MGKSASMKGAGIRGLHGALEIGRTLADAGNTILSVGCDGARIPPTHRSLACFHEKNRTAAPRRKCLEQGKPVHRLDRRGSFGQRSGGSTRSRHAAYAAVLHFRSSHQLSLTPRTLL